MPRGGEVSLGPFGGLKLNSHPERIAPSDAAHCMDTDTSQGWLRRRPRVMKFTSGEHVAGDVSVLHAGNIGATSILASYYTNNTNYWKEYDSGSSTGLGFAHADSTIPSYVDTGTMVLALAGTTTALTGTNTGYSHKLYLASGTLTTARIGIAQPTVAPTSALDAGGSLTSGATYNYRYSYYNSNTGFESAVGVASTSRTPSAGNLSISVGVTASSDAQVTGIRLYRQKETVDSTWYLVTTLANSTASYDDGNADTTLDKTLANTPRFVDNLPPDGSIGCYHNQRVWYVRTSDGLIVPSEFQQPELCSYGTTFKTPHKPTALFSAWGYLIIFTAREIYYISGYGPESWTMDVLTNTTGCISRNSIAEIDGALYFAGYAGVYRLSGENVELLSEDIGPLYRAVIATNNIINQASGAFDPISGCYVLNYFDTTTDYADATQGVPDGNGGFGTEQIGNRSYNWAADWSGWWQLAYNIKRGTWNRWACRFSTITNGYVPETYSTRLIAAFGYSTYPMTDYPGYIGYIDKFGGNDFDSDGSSKPDFLWRSGSLSFGTKRPKRFFYTAATWERNNSVDDTVEIQYSTDDRQPRLAGGIEGAGIGADDVQEDKKTWPIGGLGRTLQLQVNAFRAHDVSISDVTVDGQVLGRR